MTPKRTRGRPRGSCTDDSGWLLHMAALIAKEPSLTVKAAARRCVGADATSTVRRLQRKWSEAHT